MVERSKKKITVTWSVVKNDKRLKITRMLPVTFVVENSQNTNTPT